MRILHCIPSMGKGGAERQVAYLATELSGRGWDVHVALLYGGPNFERLVASGATVHQLAAVNNHDPRIVLQIERLARRLQPDLIQTWLTQMDVMGGFVACRLGIPWVLTERSSAQAYPRTVKHWLRKRIGPRAAAIVANSRGGVSYWRQNLDSGMPRLYCIPNAVPIAEIAQAREADAGELPFSSPLILFAGRFSPEKNLATLVAALRKVINRRDVVAVLCGDGPLLDSVREQVREFGLAGRVLLPGYIANLWGFMKRASVLVAPSSFEGHPNSVIEAAACGTPLIVSDIPAHREFLDTASAVFVNPSDSERIARAIEQVLASPEEARIRANNARGTVLEWSAAAMADSYEAMYEEILKGSLPAGRSNPASSAR